MVFIGTDNGIINPLRAKSYIGSIKKYPQLISFLHIDTTQVIEILPLVA